MSLLELILTSIVPLIGFGLAFVTMRNIAHGEDPILALTKAFFFWEYLRWPFSGRSASWMTGSRLPWVSDVAKREQQEAQRKADQTITKFGRNR